MRVLVCGGRDFQDARQMYSWLDGLLPAPVINAQDGGQEPRARSFPDIIKRDA